MNGIDYLKRKRPLVQSYDYLQRYDWTERDLTNSARGKKWKSDRIHPVDDRLDAFGNLEW